MDPRPVCVVVDGEAEKPWCGIVISPECCPFGWWIKNLFHHCGVAVSGVCRSGTCRRSGVTYYPCNLLCVCGIGHLRAKTGIDTSIVIAFPCLTYCLSNFVFGINVLHSATPNGLILAAIVFTIVTTKERKMANNKCRNGNSPHENGSSPCPVVLDNGLVLKVVNWI